jgi:VanZ family protein
MIENQPIPLWRKVFRLSFAGFLLIWTVMLLVPVPKESAREVLGSDEGIFWFGKTLHIGVYAGLTIFAGLLAYPARHQLRLFLLMLGHGAFTEYLQMYVNRGSSARDVVLDTIGVALGVALSWRYWRESFHYPAIVTNHEPG